MKMFSINCAGRSNREKIFDAKTITSELGKYQSGVSSENAKDIVKYLSAFEAVNLDAIPVTVVSHQFGWLRVGEQLVFLRGNECIAPEERSEGDTRPKVVFRGTDRGESNSASRFSRKGSTGAWAKALARAMRLPIPYLCVVAALAAPLLRIVGCGNLIVDLSGPTTTGKTSAARMAASVWGSPSEAKDAGYMRPFQGTNVYFERQVVLMRDLPTIFDDTQGAKNDEQLSRLIYEFAQGSGSGRGTPTGSRVTPNYRGVLMLTGEAKATSKTNDGGTRVRVLAFTGRPFGEDEPATGDMIIETLTQLEDAHGQAGRKFTKFLVNNHTRRKFWKARFLDLRQHYDSTAKNAFQRRQSSVFAVLKLTAELAHEAGIAKWFRVDPIERVKDQLLIEVGEADQAKSAFTQVVEWVHKHGARIAVTQTAILDNVPNGNQDRSPNQGWGGCWIDKHQFASDTPRRFAIFPTVLREILERAQFNFAGIIQAWKARGWLLSNKGRSTMQFRTGSGHTVYLYAFSAKAFTDSAKAL